MDERLDGGRDWPRQLCRIAVIWRDPGQISIRDLFAAAAPDFSDRKAFEVDAWNFSVEDQPATPLPYLKGTEVGFCEEDGTVSSLVTPGHRERLRRLPVPCGGVGAEATADQPRQPSGSASADFRCSWSFEPGRA